MSLLRDNKDGRDGTMMMKDGNDDDDVMGARCTPAATTLVVVQRIERVCRVH